jgi:hypothetical protein
VKDCDAVFPIGGDSALGIVIAVETIETDCKKKYLLFIAKFIEETNKSAQ